MTERQPRGIEQSDIRDRTRFCVERARELQPEMEREYQSLHENPELGGEEFETAKRVKRFLEEIGVEVVGEQIGGTGIVGYIRGAEGGPTVALRADMDALPIQESEKNNPKSKRDGVMHACGHDLHTPSLMGSAKVLKEMAGRGELPGNVILMFQPSEEKAHQKQSGAVRMVRFLDKNGYRDEIGAFFGLHVARMVERGQVILKDGVQMASSGEVDIKLSTKGGHIMDAYEVPNLHIIFSKITERLSEVFRVLYKDNKALVASRGTAYAGSGYNVLPAEAGSTWAVRVASPLYKELRSEILAEIKRVVREAVLEHKEALKGSKYGGDQKIEIEITPNPGYRPVIHRDEGLVQCARNTAEAVIEGVGVVEEVLMGGEDFSFYLEEFHGREIPGVFVMVGGANPEKGIPRGSHHSPDFKVDNDVMGDMAAMYSVFALKAIEGLRERQR